MNALCLDAGSSSLKFAAYPLDDAANAANAANQGVSTGRIRAMVIPTDENLMIARHTIAAVPALEKVS